MKRKSIYITVLKGILYSVLFFICVKISQGYRLAPGSTVYDRIARTGPGLSEAFRDMFMPPSLQDLIFASLVTGAAALLVLAASRRPKNFRQGAEFGSARWGTARDIEPFIDPVFRNNLILTNSEMLSMDPRPKDPSCARNKNVLVVGGSGSGKTRYFVKPNILQDDGCSVVVTDPKGSLITDCGKYLRDRNYNIKVFNTINFKKSHRYNPFEYIRSEKDILRFVTLLMENTRGEQRSPSDDFWVKAESLLYTALVGYMMTEYEPEQRNFSGLVDLVSSLETRENDENFVSEVDKKFLELEKNKGQTFAVRQYRKYKLAAGKTSKSINISCGARLAPFDIQEVRDITSADELGLDRIGEEKTALFLIMSDSDSTFNFLISMVYSQLFSRLCEKADDEHGGTLPVRVKCLIDECANIGRIPNLEKLMATIRSRGISASLILQAQSQLKSLYKDAETIIGNCDSYLYLGGREPTTLRELNQFLGKETIDQYNTGENRGRETSRSISYSKLGRDLLSVDEIIQLKGNSCILQIRGLKPFLSEKYHLEEHPNYRFLADADKGNVLDVESILRCSEPLKNDTICEVI